MTHIRQHHSVLVPFLLALVLTAAGAGSPDFTTRAASPATEQSALPSGTAEETLRDISCPSVRVCYVVGSQGSILSTHDAGATWQAQPSRSPSSLATITCPAISACFALTEGCLNGSSPLPVLNTTNGGRTWAERSHPLGCALPGLACVNGSTCSVQLFRPPSGDEVIRTMDGGRSWRSTGALTRDFGGGVSVPLSCPSATVCYAGGYNVIGRSTGGAKRWLISHVGGAACSPLACYEFHAIACPTQRICFAGASYYHGGVYHAVAVTTQDGFRTWKRHLIPGLGAVAGGPGPGANHVLTPGMGALSCPTPTTCIALGRAGTTARTTDGGKSWRVVNLPGASPLTAIACPSASTCYAAGRLRRLVRSSDSGKTWHDVVPAIFFSGTYNARPQLHTYSPWFTATGPWQVTAGVYPDAPPCPGVTGVRIAVQTAAAKRVAVPVRGLMPGPGEFYTTVRIKGRLRVDIVSAHCADFSVRIDGVR